MKCARCLTEKNVRSYELDRAIYVPLCDSDIAQWTSAVEFARVQKIWAVVNAAPAATPVFAAPARAARVRSIFAEWVERLRCEENVAATKRREAEALAANAAPTDEGKS